MSRLTRDGAAEPVSRDQILRHARGQGNVHFPCSADHEQDWQPYPVDPYSAICDDHTYIHGLDTRRVWLRSDFSIKAKKEKKREKIEYDIRHTPSGQSRVYRVTQLGTDSMAFTPESPLTKGQETSRHFQMGAALAGHHEPVNRRLPFPHPLLFIGNQAGVSQELTRNV